MTTALMATDRDAYYELLIRTAETGNISGAADICFAADIDPKRFAADRERAAERLRAARILGMADGDPGGGRPFSARNPLNRGSRFEGETVTCGPEDFLHRTAAPRIEAEIAGLRRSIEAAEHGIGELERQTLGTRREPATTPEQRESFIAARQFELQRDDISAPHKQRIAGEIRTEQFLIQQYRDANRARETLRAEIQGLTERIRALERSRLDWRNF